MAGRCESRPEGESCTRNQQAIYAAGGHNLNLRQHGTAGTEVAVVLKIGEQHDKIIGHYLNIKHYQ